MKGDQTTLKCSEINIKEPKTWAWVAAIIASLLMCFTSFSVIGDGCWGSFWFAFIFGLILLMLAFLCVLRCCTCSSKFALKITPYTQNYWFKAGIYSVVGILGLIVYGVETCSAAGIAVIYVIAILAGILFLVLGFMNRGRSNDLDEPTYTGSAVTEGSYTQSV